MLTFTLGCSECVGEYSHPNVLALRDKITFLKVQAALFNLIVLKPTYMTDERSLYFIKTERFISRI